MRSLVAGALPEAEEILAYNMPGFRVDGTVVANYAAFSKQCGLCLLRVAISDHAEEIAAAGFKAIKTGITFPPRRPIPDGLVERLARASQTEAAA